MTFQFPFLGVGHRIDSELFDVLKKANLGMSTYTQGRYMHEFEEKFSTNFGLKNCLSVSNAVSGIELIADDIDIQPGDEVLCPAHTYCASAYPFLKRGASIKWLDINPTTFQIDEDIVLNAISSKTRVLMSVHLYGSALNISNIYPLLREKGIVLIEDCAQSIGALCNNISVGALADYSVFSFQSHKNISTLGEGGMVSVKSDSSFSRMIKQRHNGHERYQIYPDMYWKPAMSNVVRPYEDSYPSNYCLNEFSCLTGSYLLDKLPSIAKKRRQNFETMCDILSNSPHLSLQEFYPHCTSSYHLAPVRLLFPKDTVDQIFVYMAANGVQCAKQYMPLYRYALFTDSLKPPYLESINLLPHTDLFYDQMLSIPFHDSLSIDDISAISNLLLKSFSSL